MCGVKSFWVFVFFAFFALAIYSCAPTQQAQEPVGQKPAVDSTQIKQKVNMYLSFGYENYKNKDYTRAIEQFRKVLELDPQNEKAFKYLADACLRHPDTTYIDTALALYKEAIKKFPQNSYFYSGLGYVYERMALRLDAVADTLSDSAAAAAMSAQADSLQELALRNFSKAFELSGRDASSAAAIGRIWLRRHNFDEAMRWFEKSVAIDSNQTAIWEVLAKLYILKDKNEDAAEAYRQLHRLVPDEPEYLLKMGQYYAKSGRFAEATDILEKYIAANPNDFRGYQYMGLALAADGKYKEALAKFKKAEELNPKSVKLMCDIAATYKDMKRYSSAQSYIAKAKKIDPSYGYIYIVEGDIIQQQAMDKVPPSGELNMEIKCQFLKASKIFRKALRDPNWSDFARSKLDYLKPYLPTKEEIAAYKFIEGKSCGE